MKRLRSPRYRPGDFRLGTLKGAFEHRDNPNAEGEVVDFSGEGVAVAVDAGATLFLSGDPIRRLRIYHEGDTFYDGEAVVRSVRDAGGKTVLGLSFQNAFMDMGKVYHLDLRLDLKDRFGRFFASIDALERIDDAFKAWVADTQFMLESLRQILAQEEESIRDVDLLTRAAAEREAVDLVSAAFASQLNRKVAELNELVGGLDEDAHQLHRSYFQRHLNPFFLEAPFMGRASRKPLRYAGDYEVMNMIYRDHREGPTLFARVLNVFACKLTAAQACVTRAELMTSRLAELLPSRPGARVASFGCGPAQEIRDLIEKHPEIDDYLVTLLDLEPNAIRFCEKLLLAQLREQKSRVQVRFIHESVGQLTRKAHLDRVLDTQDVILSVGLFDYFSDRMFEEMASRLYELLRPGGHLFIGNMSPENDSRFFMEYMAEWFLHYRTEEQLLALVAGLPAEAKRTVEVERLGANFFLHIVKP